MNGYISLTLGDKIRGVKFGNRALLDIMAKHKFSEGIKFSFDIVVDLVYFGLLNNCINKKETPDFTEDEVALWVDDLPMPKLMDVFTVFQQSYTGETASTDKKNKTEKK